MRWLPQFPWKELFLFCALTMYYLNFLIHHTIQNFLIYLSALVNYDLFIFLFPRKDWQNIKCLIIDGQI